MRRLTLFLIKAALLAGLAYFFPVLALLVLGGYAFNKLPRGGSTAQIIYMPPPPDVYRH